MNLIGVGMFAVGAAGLSVAAMLCHPAQKLPGLSSMPGIHNIRYEPLDKPVVPEFSGYGNWAKVNTTPQYIMSKLDLMCSAPSQAQVDAEESDPHVRHYMLCYVNTLGEQAMLYQKNPKFPVGSVVLNEKLNSADPASKRSLITAMVKHEAGYDSAHGDWEYVVANGDATVLQARGKLANCGGCHAEKKNKDYVFRDEMGADRLAKLR